MFPSAPLLPKLRGHFAEFLNKDSPVRLRILILPTCVGLRYGRHFDKLATFLASVKSHASLLNFAPSSAQAYRLVYFTAKHPRSGNRVDHHPAHAILLCHCIILMAVQESQPAVHRLRLPSSA